MRWHELGAIKSQTSKFRVYGIEMNEPGEARCSCPSFMYADANLSVRSCKHLESSQGQRLLELGRGAIRPPRVLVLESMASPVFYHYKDTGSTRTPDGWSAVDAGVLARFDAVVVAARMLAKYWHATGEAKRLKDAIRDLDAILGVKE